MEYTFWLAKLTIRSQLSLDATQRYNRQTDEDI